MFKRVREIAIVAALLAAAPVAASSCDCGEFEVGARALIWQSHYCPVVIGRLQEDGGLRYTSFELKSDYDWGVRAFGEYRQGCFFVGAYYTWYESTSTGSARDAQGRIFTPYGIELTQQGAQVLQCNLATAQSRANYQSADFRLGYSFWRNCHGDLYAYGAVRWVDIEFLQTCSCFNGLGNVPRSATLRTNSSCEGAGLGVGIGGRYDVWCGIGVFGEAGLAGIFADRKMPDFSGTLVGEAGTVITVLDYPNYSSVVTATDMRVGLDYTYRCGCWAITAEVGYELNYFIDAILDRRDLPGDCTEPSQLAYARDCYSIGYGGPFFGARVGF